MTARKQHPAELRERAVAMVFELRAASGSSRGTLASVGHKLGVNPIFLDGQGMLADLGGTAETLQNP
jgi:hypothetical protein